jgi:hypothetical protein
MAVDAAARMAILISVTPPSSGLTERASLGFRDERAVSLHARLSRADHGPAASSYVFCGFCLFRG